MGGRGSSSGISISEAMTLSKSLPSARYAETRAYNAYQKASGAVIVTPEGRNNLLASRRKTRDAAYKKYLDAKEKRESIEAKLDKYTKKKKRGIVPF